MTHRNRSCSCPGLHQSMHLPQATQVNSQDGGPIKALHSACNSNFSYFPTWDQAPSAIPRDFTPSSRDTETFITFQLCHKTNSSNHKASSLSVQLSGQTPPVLQRRQAPKAIEFVGSKCGRLHDLIRCATFTPFRVPDSASSNAVIRSRGFDPVIRGNMQRRCEISRCMIGACSCRLSLRHMFLHLWEAVMPDSWFEIVASSLPKFAKLLSE